VRAKGRALRGCAGAKLFMACLQFGADSTA